jgi:Uma2 family endonuclease
MGMKQNLCGYRLAITGFDMTRKLPVVVFPTQPVWDGYSLGGTRMTSSPLLKAQERFTYADYLTWPENERWELIDGVPHAMSPAPSRLHQEISGMLFGSFFQNLKGKKCKLYAAPFDVRLSEGPEKKDDDIETVVQPDIVVVCDHGKLDDRGCCGAPDLVIEILSPSTSKMDMQDKFFLYQRVGVKEYWVVHPSEKTVMVFHLNEQGEYGRADMYADEDKVAVPLLGDIVIDLKEVFA